MGINWKATLKSTTVWVNGIMLIVASVLTDPEALALLPPDWMPRILQAQAIVNLLLRYKTNGTIRWLPAAKNPGGMGTPRTPRA